MIEVFREHMNNPDNMKLFEGHHTCIIKSVISSVFATIIHGWCDAVYPQSHDYEKDFLYMFHSVFSRVYETLELKMQDLNHNKHEVH